MKREKIEILEGAQTDSRVLGLSSSNREDLYRFFNKFIVANNRDYLNLNPKFFKDRSNLLSLASADLLKLFDPIRDVTRDTPYLLIKDFPMSEDLAYGDTPADWQVAAKDHSTIREESYVALAAACLGDIFSWPTLQNGRLIHNVLPIKGDESEQNGHSSDVELAWHTEDAFHPCRGDYLILFGIRNHDAVGTTLMSIKDAVMTMEQKEILFEKKYKILPDNEHLRQVKDDTDSGLISMRKLREDSQLVSVLFGSIDSPYLRIDPFFMECSEKGGKYEKALQELIAELNRVKTSVVIESGDMLIIDNYLSVHGRAPFKARFDGSDRWLKKSIISRDIRKAKAMGFKLTNELTVY